MTVEVCSVCDIAGCGHIRERKARSAQPVAWYIDTHGVASVAIRREDLGLLHSRYARPLYFGDPTPPSHTTDLYSGGGDE